jgi:predicted nuclease of predicted toxin-antitoxin system
MNLPPRWVGYLRDAGFESEHWFTIGETTATDALMMRTAQDQGAVVLTNDLDFGTILASSGAEGPNVIQTRAADLRPQVLAPLLIKTIGMLRSELDAGALVTLEA